MRITKEQYAKIQKYIQEFEIATHATIVYLTISGSKLYGTDNENSDLDIKGLFIPSKTSILIKKDLSHFTRETNKDKNTFEDIDFTLHSIHTYLNNLIKSETGSIDILFSMFNQDNIIYENTEFTSLIKEHYEAFLNKNMKAFIGYSLGQSKKFGIKGKRYEELKNFLKDFSYETPNDKLSTKINTIKNYIIKNNSKYIKVIELNNRNHKSLYVSILGKLFEDSITIESFHTRIKQLENQFGKRTKQTAETTSKTDFKALYHALRVAYEVHELLKTRFIKLPLIKANYLKEVKEGFINPEDIVEEIQKILEEVDILLLHSELPEEVDEQTKDLFLLRLIDNFA